jgi:hypothetical protein
MAAATTRCATVMPTSPATAAEAMVAMAVAAAVAAVVAVAAAAGETERQHANGPLARAVAHRHAGQHVTFNDCFVIMKFGTRPFGATAATNPAH